MYNWNRGMESDIEKCAMPIMKSEKRKTAWTIGKLQVPGDIWKRTPSEMKENIRIPHENEKLRSIVEISSKG